MTPPQTKDDLLRAMREYNSRRIVAGLAPFEIPGFRQVGDTLLLHNAAADLQIDPPSTADWQTAPHHWSWAGRRELPADAEGMRKYITDLSAFVPVLAWLEQQK